MDTRIRIGDKVRCIDSRYSPDLIYNKVYTVLDFDGTHISIDPNEGIRWGIVLFKLLPRIKNMPKLE